MYAFTPAEKLVSIFAVVWSCGSVDDDSVCHADSHVDWKWCTRIWMSLSMSDADTSPRSSASVPAEAWRDRSIWIMRSCAVT